MDRLSLDSWRAGDGPPLACRRRRERLLVRGPLRTPRGRVGAGSGIVARARPPPLHSDAVVMEPGVTAQRLADCLANRPHAGVKDSFATLDLSGLGMQPLFTATWSFRPARAASSSGRWTVVSDDATLAAHWSATSGMTHWAPRPMVASSR